MYRAVPITQRDGSALANSNCRMAAGATVIDYDTLGQETSTGAEMRSHQADQSGGTDSGDLAQAWRWYGQTLTVRDGRAFDDALRDLHAGRAVVLELNDGDALTLMGMADSADNADLTVQRFMVMRVGDGYGSS